MQRDIEVYILAKNEESNIGDCLQGLQRPGVAVTVLDSGSSDKTVALALQFQNVAVETYSYRSHCEAYNWITSQKATTPYVMILDADMRVEEALWREMSGLIGADGPQVIQAPVTMCVEGVPLKYGSLYPPKPILFKTGPSYFTAAGHGEKLISDGVVVTCLAHLIHDDRKPYEAFLESQCRYSRNFISRSVTGKLDFQDRLRANTLLMMWLVPLYAWLVRRGWLSGKAGKAYALDRLIAEAIRCRYVLAGRLQKDASRRT